MNELSQSKQVMVIQLLDMGYSRRAVARIAGCTSNTAVRYGRIYVPYSKCPCGKDSKHQGWCKFRFSHSPSRQAFMASIGHLKQKIDPLPPTLFFPYIMVPKCENCGAARGTGARFCSVCYWIRAAHSTVNPYWQVSLDRENDAGRILHEVIASDVLTPDEILMRKEEGTI